MSKTKDRPDQSFIQDLVQAEIRQYKGVFIVIDALDECSDENNTRGFLLDALQKLPVNVQLLLTSRRSINILQHFPDCKNLAVSAHNEDVKHYVKSRLPHLDDFVKRDPILQEDIINGIAETADGR